MFNYGKHRRDFTYIDDIVEGVMRTLDQDVKGNSGWDGDNPDPATSRAPWRVYNIGNQSPVELMDYISTLEKYLGKQTEKILLPLQPGDVPDTFADVEALVADVGYRPRTTINEGIERFVKWYQTYYI